MTWQLFILLSVFLSAISTLLQKVLLRDDKSDPVAFSILFQLLTGLLVAICGFGLGDMSLKNFTLVLPNLILMVLLYGFGNVFLFWALKKIDASKFTIIFSGRAIFTIIASTLIIQETLSQRQIIGVVLIITSIIIVSYLKTKFRFDKAELAATVAALFFGFATTNDRIALSSMSLYPYVSLAFVAPALFILMLNPSNIYKIKSLAQSRIFTKIFFLCIVYALSAITFFIALQKGTNSSQVATVNLTSVIITVLMAILILKEKENMKRKLFAAVLSFFGLLLIT